MVSSKATYKYMLKVPYDPYLTTEVPNAWLSSEGYFESGWSPNEDCVLRDTSARRLCRGGWSALWEDSLARRGVMEQPGAAASLSQEVWRRPH